MEILQGDGVVIVLVALAILMWIIVLLQRREIKQLKAELQELHDFDSSQGQALELLSDDE